jgi:hypothetical protein
MGKEGALYHLTLSSLYFVDGFYMSYQGYSTGVRLVWGIARSSHESMFGCGWLARGRSLAPSVPTQANLDSTIHTPS